MNAMKITAICFGFFGGVTGTVAARYWLQSSKIPVKTPWKYCEPPETEDKAMGWQVATLEAFTESATLNKKAAGWTAASVFFSTVSCFLGKRKLTLAMLLFAVSRHRRIEAKMKPWLHFCWRCVCLRCHFMLKTRRPFASISWFRTILANTTVL
ncbi:MAG TPA: hypothetical protein VKG65_09395 [Terriglobales bacterium]|nr:hypothetical protein [Terriglobales bacterium]